MSTKQSQNMKSNQTKLQGGVAGFGKWKCRNEEMENEIGIEHMASQKDIFVHSKNVTAFFTGFNQYLICGHWPV